MVGKEINLDNIGQELREETARWLGEKYGPEITEEEIDLHTERAHKLIRDIIEASKKIGIAPEILAMSFRGKF